MFARSAFTSVAMRTRVPLPGARALSSSAFDEEMTTLYNKMVRWQ